MQAQNITISFPPYLESYGSLLSHLDSQFAELTPQGKSAEKGEKFAEFTLRLVPHLPSALGFERPQRNKKKTHDKGIDLTCLSLDGMEIMLIQAKYSIRSVEEFDSVISKFQSYDAERRGQQKHQTTSLFPDEESTKDAHGISARFMIVTTSDMKGITQKYERSHMASRPFYDAIIASGRLEIVDGPVLFPIIREAYRKQLVLPTNVILEMAQPYIHMESVYVGIIAGSLLKALYDQYGNALFLENIREFLGQVSGRIGLSTGQVTVNKEIARTLAEEPEKFLSRNNGITFRAASVEALADNKLRLDGASIVNGCQTTMSVVHSDTPNCYVLVKVVEAVDTWDIAEAANFQNEIRQLDLRLARYIRPQEIRAVSTKVGVGFKSPSDSASAFALLDVFYQTEITYEEVRALFIGLFSNTPNNAIDNNYARLKNDLIHNIFDNSESKEQTFEILFKLHRITEQAAQAIQALSKDDEDTDTFKRFWSDDKPNYRAFLAILTACGCLHQNIYLDDPNVTFQTINHFLNSVHRLIDNKPELFIRYFRQAFVAVTIAVEQADGNPDKLLQSMYTSLGRVDFRNLYNRPRRLAQNDDKLLALEAEYNAGSK